MMFQILALRYAITARIRKNAREAQHDVHETHEQRVDPSPEVARQGTEQEPDQASEACRNEAHEQRNSRSVDHATYDIASKPVRPQWMRPGRRAQDVLRIDGRDIVRRQDGRENRDHEQCRDDARPEHAKRVLA
jgi:hypothetical protein